jgi:hypothetical protein
MRTSMFAVIIGTVVVFLVRYLRFQHRWTA